MTSDRLTKSIHSLKQITKSTSISSSDDTRTHGKVGGIPKKKTISK